MFLKSCSVLVMRPSLLIVFHDGIVVTTYHWLKSSVKLLLASGFTFSEH